ncbi:hypothetical protein HYPSUDRAFT_39445 [Hypholoma sublateritium FD-334 SS-4]|uniref:NAD(P)-binding protein n=1 Tax=Hypholoma sublateritium (strain FD-334 SS-4) TaxID=945553 RepID=A0A0D2PWR4_HYPSF|nr:hypothetical protein HYPSUDRAFT_39445 [Hypholoma sublateritium FD-334 SS-4]
MTQKYVWFITGTSSGLGSSLLHEALSAGHSVVATTRKPAPLQAELDSKYDLGTLKRVLVLKLDVTDPEDVKAAFAKATEKFGRVDIVVNNAGYAIVAEVEAAPLEGAHAQFDVMFWGPVHISKEAMRIFREVNPAGEGGAIFNISSSGGYNAQPNLAYYNAAKFALEGFTESLRAESAPEWNIQATIIEPGGFNTEWRGGNLTILPQLPAYDNPKFPSSQWRSMFDKIPFIGDRARAAKAFLILAEKRKELPLRIQFGSDSLAVVRHTAKKTISDSEKWAAVSHSTNMEGIDPEEYTKNLLVALGS